jgi:hypothetical protein
VAIATRLQTKRIAGLPQYHRPVFGIQVQYHQGKVAKYERRADSVRKTNDRRIIDWGLCMSANVAQLQVA